MKLLITVLLIFVLSPQVSALEIEAPQVPQSATAHMPENTYSFGDGLLELLKSVFKEVRPDLAEASRVCLGIICMHILVAVIRTMSASVSTTVNLAGCTVIAAILISSANSMIQLASQTIQDLSEYGKLLYPVMTTALAAQGGITTSAALYTGTAFFNALLGSILAKFLIPMIYCYLSVSIANRALGEDMLCKIGDFIKSSMSWILKTLLTVFTTYMSITGVVSGTTDAAALKATKVTISTVVPVVGGILSETSEAVLVSAGLMKNAAGIYGILAILAVFMEPFLRIGIQYLMLKITAAACSILGTKEVTGMVDDFSTSMGLLLAITGAVCLRLLLSTVCFMKGVG